VLVAMLAARARALEGQPPDAVLRLVAYGSDQVCGLGRKGARRREGVGVGLRAGGAAGRCSAEAGGLQLWPGLCLQPGWGLQGLGPTTGGLGLGKGWLGPCGVLQGQP
jgi:hypothetical protein